MPRVTLSLSGTEVLCREEHPSLLVALEAHQVEVEYQCREGYCGASRTRPTKPQFVGRVRRSRHPAISALILQEADRFIREIRKQSVHARLVI